MTPADIDFVTGLQVYAAAGIGVLAGMALTLISGALAEINHKE